MWFRRLGIQLIFFVSLTAVIVKGFFAYSNIRLQEGHLNETVVRGAVQISETVKKSIEYDMLKDQRDRAYMIMQTIGEQEGIEKVRIFNKEGRITFSPDSGETGQFVDKKAEACYACHAVAKPLERLTSKARSRVFWTGGHRVLGVINPIYNERDCYTADCHAHPKEQTVLGVIDVLLSLKEVDREMAVAGNRIILTMVLAILAISVIIGVYIQRFVSKPVRELVSGTRQVALGNLNYTLAVRSQNEIGELAASFNKMTEDLKGANREIQNLIDTLEQKVAERTEELKRAQSQLLQSEKLASIGKLAAGVAHEINNPLTGILTNSSLMLEDLAPADPRREDLQTVVAETLRCRKIVKGLLDFSRQTAPQKQALNLNQAVQNVLSLIQNQVAFQNIKIATDLDPSLPAIMADQSQIQQVFLNIVLNAADAMPKGGMLTIASREHPEEGTAEVRFRDSGSGIPEEIKDKLFEPFFTTKKDGTGLGLSIAYGIVERHRGRLNVESAPGQGTTMIVTLPLQIQEDED